MTWQLEETKQKFSQLVRGALDDGPQVMTRRGEEVVGAVSATELQRLTEDKSDCKDYLLSGPDLSALDLERRADLPRDIEP